MSFILIAFDIDISNDRHDTFQTNYSEDQLAGEWSQREWCEKVSKKWNTFFSWNESSTNMN